MKKKEHLKNLARERVDILMKNALREKEAKIAASQALLARKISMRYRLKLPYEIRQLYCKSCKRFVVPGRTARVRLGRSNAKAIRITCLMCGYVYRKVLSRNL